MEITGKITDVLQEQSGQGAKGTWRKKEYVLETEAKFPKKICLSVWGDKIDQFNFQQGQKYSVEIDLESREFKGRWYTEVKAWNAKPLSGGGASSNGNTPPPHMEEPPFAGNSDNDDLPF